MNKNKSYTIYRWFAVSIVVILILSIWIKNLKYDMDNMMDREFIYKISLIEKDSIINFKNKKIDSLIHYDMIDGLFVDKEHKSRIQFKPINSYLRDTVKLFK